MGVRRGRFTFRRRIAATPMPLEEWRAAERILARLAARAYAAEHPELFQPGRRVEQSPKGDSRTGGNEISGSSAAGAPVAGAPPANAGGPEDLRSVEHGADRDGKGSITSWE